MVPAETGMTQMSARTDRIAKLTDLIAVKIAANQPNNARKLQDKLVNFQEMTDDSYDYLMALNTAMLADPKLNSQDFYRSYYSRKEG
jgi:hypothetical protein